MKMKTSLIGTAFLLSPFVCQAWHLPEEDLQVGSSLTSLNHLFEPLPLLAPEAPAPALSAVQAPAPLAKVEAKKTFPIPSEPIYNLASLPTAEPLYTPEVEPQLNKIPSDLADAESDKAYRKAIGFLKRKQIREAEATLRQSLKRNPDHLLSRIQLAKVLILKQNYLEAELTLTQHEDPLITDPEYLQTLALVYEQQGKTQEALTLLQQVPKTYSRDPDFLALLASLYHQMGNYPLAQEHYRQLLATDPDNEQWLLGFTISLDSDGQTKQAIQGYHHLLRKGRLEEPVMAFVKERLGLLESIKR